MSIFWTLFVFAEPAPTAVPKVPHPCDKPIFHMYAATEVHHGMQIFFIFRPIIPAPLGSIPEMAPPDCIFDMPH